VLARDALRPIQSIRRAAIKQIGEHAFEHLVLALAKISS
jgi:hypothetical protein